MPTDPRLYLQNSTPPMGLVVLPSGLVVYEFEGVISANGLFLPEATFLAPAEQNKVAWRDAAKAIHSYLYGAVNVGGTESILAMIANAENPRNEGLAVIEALDSTGRIAALFVDSRHEPGVPIAALRAQAAAVVRTIFQSGLVEGESGFWQLPPEKTAKRLIEAAGNVIAEWGAEEFRSNVVTVGHELGVAPTSVQLTPQTLEASTVPVTARLIEGSKGVANFKFMLQAPVKVAAATKVKVDWAAFV